MNKMELNRVNRGNLSYIHSIDILRGLAALMVCFFHFTCGNKDFLPVDSIFRIYGHYGHYGVQIFFVISGLVIPFSMYRSKYRLKNFRKFLTKRIIRIEPPYLLSVVLAILLLYVSTLSPYYRGNPFSIDFFQLFLHIGYLNAFFDVPWLNPVYWTLAIEFQYYLFIALFFPLINNSSILKWLPFLILFNIILFIFPSGKFIFNYSLYFTLGILSYKYLIKQISSKLFLALIIICVATIFYRFGAPAMLSGLVPVLIITFLNINFTLGKFFGDISYSLYLTHVLIGGRVLNLAEVFISSYYMRVFCILIALLISVIFAFLFYRFCELPFKIVSKKVSYKQQ